MPFHTTPQIKNATIILRWALLLPVSFMSAWLAWFSTKFANYISLSVGGISADAIFVHKSVLILSHTAMGAAFVFSGTYIAPGKKKIVAISLSCLGFFVVGMLLLPAIMLRDYLAIFANAFTCLGISAALYESFRPKEEQY